MIFSVKNTSRDTSRSSPTRDNDSPRPARNSSSNYVSPSSSQQTTAHHQGRHLATTLPSESGPDTHRRARDPSLENRNLRPHPSTLSTSPAPAPHSTVAYTTQVIDLTTGIDPAESADTIWILEISWSPLGPSLTYQLLFRVTHAFDTMTTHSITASTSTGTISAD